MLHELRQFDVHPERRSRGSSPTTLGAGWVIAVVLLLGGCAQADPHIFRFESNTSGVSGQTSVVMAPDDMAGDIALVLAGTSYSGRWDYRIPTPGVALVGSPAVHGMRAGPSPTVQFGVPESKRGTIHLSSPGGASIQCRFSYSPRSSSGSGDCHDAAGQTYNLQISH